jgi:hypothetical protein
MSDEQDQLVGQCQFLIQFADLRIEETECRRQPRAVDFQRCEHLAELTARKVIRQLHHQPPGFFNGRKKCVAHECFLLSCCFLSNVVGRALDRGAKAVFVDSRHGPSAREGTKVGSKY